VHSRTCAQYATSYDSASTHTMNHTSARERIVYRALHFMH